MLYPTINPFDPFGIYAAWQEGWTRPKPDMTGIPIDVRPRSSDPGITIETADNAVILRGETHGDKRREVWGGLFDYDEASSVSFTLDIDRVVEDTYGDKTTRERNRRIFQVITGKGWSTQQLAQQLAAKVNEHPDFRATVEPQSDGSVRIAFSRH